MSVSTPFSTSRWIRRMTWGVAFILVAAGIAVACDSGGANEDEEEEQEIAQTFSVTVESTSESYMYSDSNEVGVAYAIDGDLGKVLTLERGKKYEFKLGAGVDPDHPLYIDRTAKGQKTDPFSNGVENAESTTGSVFFSVPTSAPDSLYYECGNHVYMGGKMMIESSQ